MHKNINTNIIIKMRKHTNKNTYIIQVQWHNKYFTGNVYKKPPRQRRLGKRILYNAQTYQS